MLIQPALRQATLLRRYKRFLADIRLPDGKEVTIHCPNTGSMKACIEIESPCWFSESNNLKRKYPYTWELATTPHGDIAGVNTGRANALVVEAINNGLIVPLQGYGRLQTEVRYGEEKSRIDVLLSNPEELCYVEVKNVTLSDGAGQGLFPDSVSDRGRKHLRELELMVKQGHRSVLIYCVQHSSIERVSPADEIDLEYGKALRKALSNGVEVYAYQADLSEIEIKLVRRLPVFIDGLQVDKNG